MSNYTKTTNFGAKDTLPSGDSQKIIRGTEFDTEFNNVATAIATKLEVDGSNNLAISGTFSSTKLIPTGGTATGNGMYLPAANTLALSTNGTERVRVDSSGNLGVGTTVGAASGTGLIIYSPTSTRLQLRNSTTGDTTGDGCGLLAFGSDLYVENRENGATLFFNNGSECARITSGGNFGVGSSSPVEKLDVRGNIYGLRVGGAKLRLADQNNEVSIESSPVGVVSDMVFKTSGLTRATLDSSGNLGIGTTSTANAKVSIASGTHHLELDVISATSYVTSFDRTSSAWKDLSIRSLNLLLETNGSERARITSGGQLCLGVTAANGSARFTVGGLTTGTSAADVFVGRTGTEADGVGLGASIQLQNTTNTTACIIQQYSNNLQFFNYTGAAWTERARIKSTGQFRFVPLSSDPSGAESGDVYYNSTSNKLKVYNGTSWVDLH